MPEEITEQEQEQEQERKPVTTDDIARYASKEILPEELDAAQRCFWYAMRDLYRAFRAGAISKQDGEVLRMSALRQYEADIKEHCAYSEWLAYMERFWRGVEESGSRYAKGPSIETADAFFEAVYRVKRKNKDV